MSKTPFTDELDYLFRQYFFCEFGHGVRLPAKDGGPANEDWCPICGMHPFEHGPPRPPAALRGIRL